MSWTERLNDVLPRVRIGTALVDIHEWAHTDQPKDGPPHRHSYFVASRIESGEGVYTAAERSHQVGPGDLLIARPGVTHRIVGTGQFRMSWVSFEVTPGHAGDEDDANVVLQGFLRGKSAIVREARVAGALWETLNEAARGPRTPGQKATLAALGPALLLSIARAGGGEEPGRARLNGQADEGDDEQTPDRHLRAVRLAVRYIEDNLDRPLRVEELAKQVNVSPRQLTRLFATVLNEPPASYVERVRLELAAGLLERTETPIKQIAAELGYPDVPTFTRAFTRQHHSPPGRFRRARHKGSHAGEEGLG